MLMLMISWEWGSWGLWAQTGRRAIIETIDLEGITAHDLTDAFAVDAEFSQTSSEGIVPLRGLMGVYEIDGRSSASAEMGSGEGG